MKYLKNKKPNLIESKFKTLLIVSILGWLILLIGQVVDNVLAGNFLGETGLSAVQIIVPISTFISAIGSFVGMGFAVKFSLLKGKGEEDKANKIIGLGIIFTLMLGVITALIMFFFKEGILGIFATSNQVKEYASAYYDWYIGIAIVQPLYILFFKVISQDGDPVWTAASSVTQVALNFVLSAFLIRSMGIVGLSLGSFISISVSILVLFVHFFTKKNSIKLKFSFNFKNLKDPFLFGFPALLGNISIAIVNFVLNLYITNNFGDAFLASFTLICFIANMKLVFGCISDCLGPFFSTAKGSGNNDDINLCFRLLKKYDIIVSLILTAVVMSLSMVIPMLFKITPESGQYVYSYSACLIIAPIFICYAFTMTLGSSYTAIGKPKITLINQIISSLLLPLGLPLLFAFLMNNYYGIIIGYAVSAALSIGIVSISLAIIHKPHRVFLAPKIEEQQFSIDVFLEDECVKKTREVVINNLTKYGIEEKPKNEILGIYDEACFGIKKMNPDKLITVRLTYGISKDKIRIIAKNNGRKLSDEEKQTELKNNKFEYKELNYIFDSNSISMSNMISFNSQIVLIDRN